MPIAPGVTLGRYRLVELLGRGGMGSVWRAQGPTGTVALKTLRAGASEIARRRFEREATAILGVRHPNVVRGLDWGRASDGALYLAMELLEGQTLEERIIGSGALAPADVVHVGLEAAAALAAVHSRGLVHRDVKPGNLFMTKDGSVLLLDFGLVLGRGDARDAETQRLTPHGDLLGTPSYAAPEQATRERAEDVRTDVWALGATLHHALAGRPPFATGGTPMAELFRIVTQAPDPLGRGIPKPLADVVGRALEKDPERRYQSMTEMRHAVEGASGAVREFSSAETTAVPRQPPLLSEEVRILSAVVAQGVRDAEAAEAVLEAIRSRGGIAAGLRGGRVVGVFGAEEAVGDEAERAVRSAYAARAYADRVGVGTGRAIWKAGEPGTVTGAAIAAAEEALVASGVGTDDETRRRVLRSFEFDGARVVGERRGRNTIPVRAVAGVEVPMVGRDLDLRRLQALVERAVSESRSQAVVVSGPPGIGKSRLRHELRRLMESDGRVLWLQGRAEPIRAYTSHALLEDALRVHADVPEGTPPEVARSRIEALVDSARLPARRARGTVDFLGEFLGIPFADNAHLETARSDPEVMRDRIRLALGDLFDGWTLDRTVILALEDVQWADAASLALVDFLLVRLASRPLVVLATARPEFFSDRPDALPGSEKIELREIGVRETKVIVQAILGRPASAVAIRSAGTPFIAEELSLAVREGADPEALPSTVEGAVQTRLAKLAAEERDLLRRAAILGQRFWTEALEALGEPDARRLLASLRRRDLVVVRPDTRLAGCEEWAFRHAVVQEVSLGMLTDVQRRALHHLAADWLAARPDAAPEEIAEHFERAGDPDRAHPLWARAAVDAQRRGDADRVLAWSERALSARLDPVLEHALRLARAEALDWVGRVEETRTELDLLGDLEDRSSAITHAARAEARRRLAEFLQGRGRYADAAVAAGDCVSYADKTDDRAARSRARARLAQVLVVAGRSDVARDVAAKAIEYAEGSGDAGARGHAEHALASIASSLGRRATALERYRASQDAFEESGNARLAVNGAVNVGAMLLALGDIDGACFTLERAVESAKALGIRRVEGWALQNLGMVLALLGSEWAGIEVETRAAAIAGALHEPRLAAAALAYRSIIRRSSDAHEALRDADAAVARATLSALVTLEPLCRMARAGALLALGKPAEASEECARALRPSPEGQAALEEVDIELRTIQAQALRARGLTKDADAALAAARERFDEELARIDDPRLRELFRALPSNALVAKA